MGRALCEDEQADSHPFLQNLLDEFVSQSNDNTTLLLCGVSVKTWTGASLVDITATFLWLADQVGTELRPHIHM